jgi:hypothetical protein
VRRCSAWQFASPLKRRPNNALTPLDLDYRYNWEQLYEGVTYRTGADPDRHSRALTQELRSLNAGVPYWVAIEAFSENGVSRVSRVVPVRPPATRR